MSVRIGNDWDDLLQEEWEKPYYLELRKLLIEEYKNFEIYPPANQLFRALQFVPYSKVKVVIIGQDPYHGPNQANGMSFSVNRGVGIPPSLRNIFQELHNDIGCSIPSHGDLTSWANVGVLLLNSTLTVRAHNANSHQNIGWNILTDKIIELLGEREEPIVFILWGKFAQNKAKYIKNPNHLILMSVHPSPLSAHRGFFGTKPFSKTNAFLKKNGIQEIDWSIE